MSCGEIVNQLCQHCALLGNSPAVCASYYIGGGGGGWGREGCDASCDSHLLFL